MRNVGIADLKAHLSEHLQAVRQGEIVVVHDRKEPVARIVPIGAQEGGLVVRTATRRLADIAPPPPLAGVREVTQLLADDREERFR